MKLAKSTVFVTHSCNTKKCVYKNFRHKKRAQWLRCKNIKNVIVIDYLQFSDMHLLFKIYKKVSFYSLHAVEGNQLLALLMKPFLKFCR